MAGIGPSLDTAPRSTEDSDVQIRLQTYDNRWTGKKDKGELARAGFSFTGIGDKVECEQCGLKLLNWTSTDDPLHEHATRRPLCPFINSRYRQLRQTKPPKHPKYQQLQDRLDSFTCWPTQYVPKAPDQLAAAGFFYIGSADRVTCFQCGITLRDWEEEHDPVTEHQRYSENCQFINKTDLDQLGVVPRNRDAGEDIQGDSQVTPSEEGRNNASAKPSSFQSNSTKLNLQSCRETEEDDANVTQQSSQCLQSTTVAAKSQSTSSVVREPAGTGPSNAGTNPANMSSSLNLAEENQRLRERGTCRVCREKGVATLFLPCGHLVTCSDCAPRVSECIVCQKTILGTVNTFFT